VDWDVEEEMLKLNNSGKLSSSTESNLTKKKVKKIKINFKKNEKKSPMKKWKERENYY